MTGIICNVLAVALGGLAGALFGQRLPEHIRIGLNSIFGICAMEMGISSITLMENMPAVILAVILLIYFLRFRQKNLVLTDAPKPLPLQR